MDSLRGHITSGLRIDIGEDYLECKWPYYLPAPEPATLATVLEQLLAVIKQLAPAPDPLCERCRAEPSPGLALLDGKPVHYCDSCAIAVEREVESAERDYYYQPGDLPRAITFGLPVALFCGIAWSFITMLWFGVTAIAAAALVGVATAWAVCRGRRKVDGTAQTLAAAFSVLGVVCGDDILKFLGSPDIQLIRLQPPWLEALEMLAEPSWAALFASAFAVLGALVVVQALRSEVRRETQAAVVRNRHKGTKHAKSEISSCSLCVSWLCGEPASSVFIRVYPW